MSDSALAAYAAKLRGLSALATSAAKLAAPTVLAACQATAAAGTTPEGKAWPPTKDGKRALPDAASALTAAAKGVAVVVTLTGPYVFWHYMKGPFRRRILPDGGAGIPPKIRDAMRAAQKAAFGRLMAP